MKKRWLAILLCGAILAGCGNAGALSAGRDAGTGSQGTESSSEKDSEGQKMGENAGNGNGTAGVGEQALPSPTKGGMYGRATYLADMVYQRVGGENTLVSPLSLDMALGLLTGGAEGRTKEELSAYLGREDYGSFAAEYMEYADGLNRDFSQMEYGGYKTAYEIANSIWVREDRKLVDNYVKKANEQFQAEIASVSFAPEQAENTAKRINDWCNEKTHEMIPSIITSDSIREDLAAILVNSLYFESPWAEKWGLTQHTFTDIDGKESEQEMLADTLGYYYENEHATAFSKSYLNGMEFVGILPKETGEFAVQDLDLETLMASGTDKYDVYARMPKLNYDTMADNIVQILQAQGVEKVFSATESDLSGLIEMSGEEVSYVSDIIQKCKIELDEEGTRAAAVTAIMMKLNGVAMMEPRESREVYLDRPFAFLIYDRENDQVLFVGKVVRL